jgi:hypothetical protein
MARVCRVSAHGVNLHSGGGVRELRLGPIARVRIAVVVGGGGVLVR